jgi:uncharacterized protein YciI
MLPPRYLLREKRSHRRERRHPPSVHRSSFITMMDDGSIAMTVAATTLLTRYSHCSNFQQQPSAHYYFSNDSVTISIMWGLSSLLGRSSVMTFLATSSSQIQPRTYATTSSSALAATQFLLRYEYIPDVLEKRGPYREGHLNLAKELIAKGSCLSGGPTGDVGMEVPTGALFIFTTSDAAKLFVEQDPYVSGGIVTGHSIEEWNVVVQKK